MTFGSWGGGSSGGVAAQLAANIAKTKATPGFDPTQIAGLVLYHHGDDLPASGSISQWLNRVTGTTYSAQATGGKQPTVGTWIDGTSKAAVFSGAQFLTNIEAPVCASLSFGAVLPSTIVVVFERTATDQDQAIVVAGDSNVGAGALELIANSSAVGELVLQSWGTAPLHVIAPYANSSILRAKTVAAVRCSAGNGKLFDNGRVTTSQRPYQASAQSQNPFLDVAIGAWGGFGAGVGAHFSKCKIRAVLIYNTELTDAQLYQISRYFGIVPSNINCVGNSLTFGQGASNAAHSYPGQIDASLNSTNREHYVANFGISATATPEMIERWARPQNTAAYTTQPQADVIVDATGAFGERSFFDPSRRNILLAWELGNDLYFGASPADALARYAAYVARAASEGWIVISATITPRGASNFPSVQGVSKAVWDANVATANAALRANPGHAYGYSIADVAAISQLADPTNGTYYNGDQVHLTDVGYALVSGAFLSRINELT